MDILKGRKQYNMFIMGSNRKSDITIYCYTDKEVINEMINQFMMLVNNDYIGFTFITEENSTKREIARFTI